MREVILKVAPPVDKELIDSIREGFETMLDRQIKFRVKEDPSIIGGFSVFIDGTVYDASMRNQLDEMLKRLKD